MSIFPYPLMLMSCINIVPLSEVRNYHWCATTYLPRRHSGKESPAEAGSAKVAVSIPGLGRSPGEGNGNSLQYSFLGNSTDRGAWQATAQGVSKESDMTEHA